MVRKRMVGMVNIAFCVYQENARNARFMIKLADTIKYVLNTHLLAILKRILCYSFCNRGNSICQKNGSPAEGNSFFLIMTDGPMRREEANHCKEGRRA
jgi:hypothetical protein